jgi:hypothetical protein
MGLLNFKTLKSSFLFMSYSELVETTVLFPKLSGKFSIAFYIFFEHMEIFFIIRANSSQVFVKLAMLLKFSGLQHCFKIASSLTLVALAAYTW